MTASADAISPEWEAVFAAILETGGTTLLLGGLDVGKTTFARQLWRRATQSGRQAAFLDADLGQSEIGPPACVGLALGDSSTPTTFDLSPYALAFVGSTSPPGHLLEYATAIRRLADRAALAFDSRLSENASAPPSASPLLLVDTGGYIQGGAALRLLLSLFDLLSPAHVVALQRHGELDPILAPMRQRTGCCLHTPGVPDFVSKKTPAFRTQRRAMRFAAYFRDAPQPPHVYSFDDAAFVGTWLGTGTPLAAHLRKFAEQSLGPQRKVYYAEMAGRHLGLMVDQPIAAHSPGLALIQEQLKAQAVTVTVAPRLKHLLLGLEGSDGRLLGLGLLEAIDFRRRTLGVLTPVRAPGAARVLHFGSLRVQPDGAEAGTLKPGEI